MLYKGSVLVSRLLVLPTLVLTSALFAAEIEPVVATSWEVRRDTQELLAELKSGPTDVAGVLEKVQSMLAEHGDNLIADQGNYLPLSEVFARNIKAQELDDDFVRMFSAVADRRLAELTAGEQQSTAWRRLALAYPGTDAASKAWQRLASECWDAGKIGLYLTYAAKAGESRNDQLKERVAAGLQLQSTGAAPPMPRAINNLEAMWKVPVPEAQVRLTRRTRDPVSGADRRLSLSEANSDVMAASDGMRFLVFDHLTGRQVGRIQMLGDNALHPLQSIPVAIDHGFIAIGLEQPPQRAVLVAVDNFGEARWKRTTQQLGQYPSISPLMTIDDLVVFAALLSNNEGPELRVYAFHIADGKPAWETLVAKIPALLHRAFDPSRMASMAPSLCQHAGAILLLSNTGLAAKIGSDGVVDRIWTYPSTSNELDDPLDQRPDTMRLGQIRSDGFYAVATPCDNDGMSLIFGPDDQQPRQYTGDGSGGIVIDVRENLALIAAKQVFCLDLKAGKLRWKDKGPPLNNPSGIIGNGTALVGDRDRMELIDLSSGEIRSTRLPEKTEGRVSFAVGDGVVITAGRVADKDSDGGGVDTVQALGRAAAFREEQLAQLQKHPDDFRPLVALAKSYEAQGNYEEASSYLMKALQKGAPAEYAQKAAANLRIQLETSMSDHKAFTGVIGQLRALTAYDAKLGTELALWQGRHHEVSGDKAAAVKAYEQVIKSPSTILEVGSHFEVQAQAAATSGLARLKAGPVPAWMQPAKANSKNSVGPTTQWINAGQRAINSSGPPGWVVANGMLVGYVDGVLAAQQLSDGQELWWNKPKRPLLGVRLVESADPFPQGGVAINVLDGTSAAAAGLQSGDILLAFNDRVIHTFKDDLIPAVIDTGVRGKFTAKVLRNNEQVVISGVLGGELIQPACTNGSVVAIWPMMPTLGPEGMWLAVLDVATGKELWRGTIPPPTSDQPAVPPILTSDDILITIDNEDLVAVALRSEEANKELWRLPGMADWLNYSQLLNERLLRLNDPILNSCALIEVKTGELLFRFDADRETPLVIDGGDCFARLSEDLPRLACYDLALGRLRWKSNLEKSGANIIAACGDAVLARNDGKQLVLLDRFSGKLRRLYGEWTTMDVYAVEDDRLYGYVRNDTSHALVAIGRPGGTPIWQQQLPNGQEMKQLFSSPEGVGCVLGAANQLPSVLALDASGKAIIAEQLNDGETIQPVHGALLVVGSKGSRVLFGAAIEAPKPVPCYSTVSRESLQATAEACLPKLNWQHVGDATYAIAKIERSLLIFVKLPAAVEAMEVRVGDAGPSIDVLNQALIFQRNQSPRFNDVPNGWQLGGIAKFSNDDGTWMSAARLEPPMNRPAGLPLQIRAAGGGAVDGAQTPWWLRSGWRAVSAPP